MNEDHVLWKRKVLLSWAILYYTFALVMFILLVTDSFQNRHWTSSVGHARKLNCLQVAEAFHSKKCYQSVNILNLLSYRSGPMLILNIALEIIGPLDSKSVFW